MKKKIAAILAAAVLTTGFGSVAFAAITQQQAEDIVRNQYSDARIHYTKEDWEHGRRIFEVKFSTGRFVDSEMEIDAETGNILSVDLDD